MDFQVFLQNQNHQTDEPLHRGTRTVVRLLLEAGLARKVGQNAVKLLTPAEWKDVKIAARTHTRPVLKAKRSCEYEHHIEPKLIALTIDNSPWRRYIDGLQ
jgi:hypothetical protein